MGLTQTVSKKIRAALSVSAAIMMLSGCGSSTPTFSLLSEEDSFSQVPDVTVGKIDVLWVIDNSGSMKSSQENVANSFANFIDLFNAKGFDYQLAVISTESYKALFSAGDEIAKLRDGTNLTSHTGTFLIMPNTPNLSSTFLTNVLLGTKGSGDERAFQSMKTSLTHPINAEFGFPRKDAFLSVVIVSDEDDFSHDGEESRSTQYSYSGMHTIQSYTDFLDELTVSTATERNYSVNTIAILDQTCLDTLNAEVPGRKIGKRYQQLATATDGIVGSLCGNFGETMAQISNRIIELSTQFYLSRPPNQLTIQVWIDGESVPQSETDGWWYNETNNSIVFHGSYIPAAGARVTVHFDPLTIK